LGLLQDEIPVGGDHGIITKLKFFVWDILHIKIIIVVIVVPNTIAMFDTSIVVQAYCLGQLDW
jgi:hypothetical protein